MADGEPRDFIIHCGLGVSGYVNRRIPAGAYFPKDSDKAVTEPVIELENGHILLDRPGIRVLTDREREVYESFLRELSTLMTGACVVLRDAGSNQASALQLLSVGLAEQRRALVPKG